MGNYILSGVVNMLFYEHGYVYDTLDGTVEKAIPELVAHAHALGINIKG